MKNYYLTVLIPFFLACDNDDTIKKEVSIQQNEEQETSLNTENQLFQEIIDSAQVDGSILIFNLKENAFISNDFDKSGIGHLPASTFKITNSIIALETGVAKNDCTLFKWNGEKRRLKNWEQDLILKQAFHYSCVPCYQEIARSIGVEQMQQHLKNLSYGNMDVDSSNLDLFWLEGYSRINQFEQIDFLRRFYHSELDISDSTESIMKRMMVIEENETYKLSGKTGWSITNEMDNGWFVGYIETKNNTYFFATNISPKQTGHMKNFGSHRKEITFKALAKLGINIENIERR